MVQNLEIYSQMDWWNPRHSLLQMASIKFDYFHYKLGSLDGLNILDIGCGGGLLAEHFAKQGAAVTGIDLSENAIKTARDHAAAGGLSIRYEVGKAENLPAKDGEFDAVVCADCLEHVDDLEKVIREISRVLKEDGGFCYDTINRNLFSKILVVWIGNPILRWQYRKLDVSEEAYSVHDWKKFIKPAELCELMDRHGLTNLETQGIRFAGFRKDGFKAKIGGRPTLAYAGYAIKETASQGSQAATGH
jgi:2-polyprenyl-6-hydroxyphenyl methylase/3-demethylubiquinone-9 3-methyltransferase